jgi:predicted transcriptional regulator
MARKKSPHLTDAELRLMEVLWRKGSATVSEVVEGLPKSVPLENKGYLRHVKDGRAFVYQPLVARGQAQESAVKHLVRHFFEGSPELLMLNLIESRQIDPKELARLKKKIEGSL